jgi:hypothetical protein
MAKKKNDLQLTSVKVHSDLFNDFKIFCIKTKFSLQKLVDRSMYHYVKDEEFRNKLHNPVNLSPTGSLK